MSDTIVKIPPNTTTVKNVTNETVVKFPVSLPGGGGESFAISYVAAQNLSAGRCVVLSGGQASYFNPSDPTHAGRAYGITKASATTGGNVLIQIMGEMSDLAFSLTANAAVYVTSNGQLTSTRPTSGLIQYAGIAVSSTKIKVDFWPTIHA